MKVNGREVRWLSSGDLNAFFGLMLDNVSNLVILSALLVGVYHMPSDLVLYRMIPGSALGVLIGDLIYTWMAIRLSAKTGREATAMPLGLDTPSLFGVALGIIGPVYMDTGNAELAWQVGMASVVIMGVVKIVLSFFGEKVKNTVPRAGLLGSIAGIAILLIAFLPMMKIFENPVAGMVSLSVIFATLIAGRTLPGNFPGAFGAVILGSIIYYVVHLIGGESPFSHLPASPIHLALPLPTLAFMKGMKVALKYLSLSVPFAIATVIGGIDVTESAEVAGDPYDAREILLAEGVATLLAGMAGGVIQSTPYIGHPAYKKMGGRAGYTLMTALFIGVGGMVGFLPYVITLIPEAAIAPILVFIGVEIITQAYQATPEEHHQAVSLSLLPSAAYLVLIEVNQFLNYAGVTPDKIAGEGHKFMTVLYSLSNGFILTALLWGGAFAHLASGKVREAFIYFLVLAFLTLFGVVHSPFPDGKLFFPWSTHSPLPLQIAVAYILMGTVIFITKRGGVNGNY